MEDYLKQRHAGAFEPEEVKLLVSAYDEALITVQARGSYLEGNFESVREDLAKHIVEAAIEGERDPVQLRQTGLAFLKDNGLL